LVGIEEEQKVTEATKSEEMVRCLASAQSATLGNRALPFF